MKSEESNSHAGQSRRSFLKSTAAAALAVSGAGSASPLFQAYGASTPRTVSIVTDPADPLVSQAPVQWAIGQLRAAVNARGIGVPQQGLAGSPVSDECVVVAGRESALAQAVLESAAASLPDVPEAIGLVRGKAGRQAALLACGSDARGVVYATL